uniref:SAC3/GANP/THP3 conserved domain-containing protein n=1 Tax=Setaria digitata TaxID=48799 RepID=A0A915Q7H0_9BILA
MSSGSFPFLIPESLRPKKASNPLSKSTGATRKQSYAPSRRKRYNDLDDPLSSPSSSSALLFKRSVDARVASGRHSVARAARVVRKRMSSTQHISNISQDLPSANMKASIFSSAQLGKRLKASHRGTARSGVDNRFSGIMRAIEPSRTWTRDSAAKDENATKAERHIEATKAESVVEKIVLPKGAIARQLKRMVGRICENDFDKYQLLDERDRLMHRGRLKSTDVENATVMQGSCPDMCPEKERYMRVVQKRLSVYECHNDGTMAPELTVKEYSRSAADQEEPLPHELRPADVLQRTMNYLVGKIANHVPETDEELAQWYDFLWNRTRAIRKDITQQMMVNETAVILIEQCVRLHIFASHRLCELNFNEFDQKMNTENLSKSLQSLRYLYDDLAKKGIFYPSEGEFRAYEIMLNLSDSNVFRQALTYRREILEASSVRLAVRLFTCLQSQNYVRFFRLLRNDATYLQCCLCHRFFNRMRHQAMYAISHSVHIMGKYPVKKFVQLLGFDDLDASLQFLDCYNVRRSNDADTGEEMMLISKTRLIEPIEEPPSRIHSWIEAKRNGYSLPEVLSGGQDVKAETVVPLNSFDEHGAYVFDAVLDNYVNENGIEQLTADDDDAVTFAFTLPSSQKEDNTINILTEKLADELLKKEVTRLCKLSYVKTLAHSLTTTLYDNILEDCLKPLCQEAVIAAKLLHRHKLAADVAKQREDEIRSLLDSLNESLLHEIIDKFICEITQKWIIKCKRIYDEGLLEDIGKSFLDDLVTEVVAGTVRKIGENEIEEGVSYVKKRLRDINERLDKLWLKQFVDHWREQINYRKEQERKKLELLESFPVILPFKSELIFRRRDGYPQDKAFFDCSSLLSEQKINAFIEKRHEKIARKVLTKWRLWTQLQIEKKEFFTTTSTSPLKRRRQYNNNYDNMSKRSEDDIRLAVALADVECERLKSFWTSYQVYNDLEDERQLSWHESLIERSSALLNYFDEETLEKGVEIARRNMRFMNDRQRWIRDENCPDWSATLDKVTCSPSQQWDYKKTDELSRRNEGCHSLSDRQCKSLEHLEERLEDFTRELDDAFRGVEERNRRYDEILKSLHTDE